MGDLVLPITGGCLCGAVRYEANEAPQSAGICHCRMCQKSNGTPFAVGVYFQKESLRFISGEPKFYESSAIAERGFCANCGSRLIYRPLSGPLIAVEVGSLDHPENISPEYHTGVEGWMPWLNHFHELPRMRTDDSPKFKAFVAATKKSGD